MKTRREHAREKVDNYLAHYEYYAYRGEHDKLDELERKIDMWENELWSATIEENGGFGLGRSITTLTRDPHFKKVDKLE